MARNSNIIIILSFALFVLTNFSSCKSKKDKDKKYDEIEYIDDIYNEPKNHKKNALGFTLNKRDNYALYKEGERWLGVKYVYGGSSLGGTDCSGMVMEIYKKVYGKKLQRNSAAIMDKNCKKISKHKLKEGDLVFFATGNNRKRISHVGIYLKDNKFIHASSSRGVVVSDLNEAYYERNYVCAGRVK